MRPSFGRHIIDKSFVLVVLIISINETIKEAFSYVIFSTELIVLITLIWLYRVTLDIASYWRKNYLLSIYIFYIFICIIRGLFIAETYFEWKALYFNAINLSLPGIIFVVSDIRAIRLLKYIGIASLPASLFLLMLGVDFTLATNIIIGAIPAFVLLSLYSPRYQLLFAIVLIILLFYGFYEARSNSVRIFWALVVVGLHKIILGKRMKYALGFGLMLPFLLLFLALNSDFNLFKKAALEGQSDTRTFIYVEAISSAINNDYLIFGRTPSRGYDTVYFQDQLKEIGSNERLSSEIGIINILTWTGLLGVSIYLLLLGRSLLIPFALSDNIYLILLALYTLIRYLLSFVEEYPGINLSYVSLWLTISILSSKNFIKMSKDEFRTLLKNS